MRALPLLLVFLLLTPAGCYRYVPAEDGMVPRGTRVRAQLTESGTEEARRYFGPGVEEVEGPVVNWNGGGLAILMQTYLSRPGFPATHVADTVRFQPAHISAVQVRELDGWRTAGLAALVVGGGLAATLGPEVLGGGASGEGNEGDDLDPDAQIILRIPLRLIFR